jgi:hypothetical protein
MSNMHEDVKFKFISYFSVTVQTLDIELRCIKTIIKAFVMNVLSRPSFETCRSIFYAYTSNDVVCDKEVPFGGLVK